MDMKLRALKPVFFVVSLLAATNAVYAKTPRELLWTSGYDYFCEGPCVSVFKGRKGAVVEFVDPANGTTKFTREIDLPDGTVLGKSGLLTELDTSNLGEQTSGSQLTTSSVPSPPAGGSGVVSVTAPIYDSYGHSVGSVVIYYIYENGVLVDVQVQSFPIVSHNHAER